MKPIVFIDGDQGTTGLQIVSRLADRTDLQLVTLPPDQRKDPARRTALLNGCDIAILCLPDDAARQAPSWVTNPRVRIIDASSAHRTSPGWVYGFPEMSAAQPAAIAAATRVTNPGCYPTGAIALLKPLVDAGLLPPDHPIAIHAVSGYTGMGRAGVELYEGARAAGAPAPAALQLYGLGLTHKHVPEIERHAGLGVPPVFSPAYGAYAQGIVLSIALHGRLLPAAVDGSALRNCLAGHYAGAQHVSVLDSTAGAQLQGLDPQALNGSNDLQLAVFDNPQRGQYLLTAVFDNLGKGASGAAVQNLDLMLAADRQRLAA